MTDSALRHWPDEITMWWCFTVTQTSIWRLVASLHLCWRKLTRGSTCQNGNPISQCWDEPACKSHFDYVSPSGGTSRPGPLQVYTLNSSKSSVPFQPGLRPDNCSCWADKLWFHYHTEDSALMFLCTLWKWANLIKRSYNLHFLFFFCAEWAILASKVMESEQRRLHTQGLLSAEVTPLLPKETLFIQWSVDEDFFHAAWMKPFPWPMCGTTALPNSVNLSHSHSAVHSLIRGMVWKQTVFLSDLPRVA